MKENVINLTVLPADQYQVSEVSAWLWNKKDHSQIFSYFIKHNLIIIDQFAFLKKHFNTGCLHRMIDD